MDYRALAEELFRIMYVINKSRPHRHFNDAMRGEAFVLQYTQYRGEPLQPKEISRFMNISTARIAVTLGSMERKGLLTRRIDPDDRRRILVELTEEGERCARLQRNEMLEHFTIIIQRLGEHDAPEFVRIMKRLAEVLAEVHKSHDGPPFDCCGGGSPQKNEDGKE